MVAAIVSPEQKTFINNLVAIANLFVNIYSLPIFQKLWYNIEFGDKFTKNNEIDNKTLAVTKLKGNGTNLVQCMIITKQALLKETSEKQYEIGFHSISISISSIIHEMGHAISNYAWIWPSDRKYLNININQNTGKCRCYSNK